MNNKKSQLIDQLFKVGNLEEDFGKWIQLSFTFLRRKYPELTSEQLYEVYKEYGGQTYLNQVKQVYNDVFSEEDLQNIIHFWTSETGRKLVKTHLPIAQSKFQDKWVDNIAKACEKFLVKE